MKKYYQLTKENSYGEEIDYIDKRFDTEEDALVYLKKYSWIPKKELRSWTVREYTVIAVM